jgi:thiol-disulfide isomerase/thioredoxin
MNVVCCMLHVARKHGQNAMNDWMWDVHDYTRGVLTRFPPYETNRYISTLTQSQKIVLKEGILFARDPVLTYQKELEKSDLTLQDEAANDSAKDSDDEEEDPTPSYMEIPPPSNYGPILQKLLESKIIFPMDRNENGSHKKKDAFVKGCSFPDYAEMEIWPSDTTDGAPVRFGFPAIRELAFEMKVEKMMGSATKPVKKTKASSTKQVQENPFVYEIFSLNDITDEIVNAERDAVLFISAPYCKLCRTISPMYTRMARQSKEENGSDIFFAKASSAGKEGKQLTFTLNVDSVPTFILFKKGQKYGEPFGVIKVPSKKLDKAIEYLTSGKEWDDSIVGMETNVRRTKLK